MIREKTKKSKSNYYVVLMAVMLIGYGLFFTSKLWFPTNTDYIDATSLYKNLKFDTYTLYLTEWNYATSDQAMEITIELQNTEVLDKKTHLYSSRANCRRTSYRAGSVRFEICCIKNFRFKAKLGRNLLENQHKNRQCVEALHEQEHSAARKITPETN